MWAMLTDISSQVDWYGNKLTKEEWKIVLTAGLKQQKVVPGLDGGFVAIGSSTSKMSIAEMADLITLGYAFGNEKGVKWSEVEVLKKIPIEAYED
ncbi:MAG: NinB protein [Parcubacteria group bacterium GW2011_GWE2_42_14]|nr:MAG: NinB protein [Parcubacteria group bacterium GW2011_GWE2_42_14]